MKPIADNIKYIPAEGQAFTGIVSVTEEAVNHPAHYGGDTPYEAIKVIEAWELGFCLGNTVKYISRAGKKDPAAEVQDLEKAAWYLERRIKQLMGEL